MKRQAKKWTLIGAGAAVIAAAGGALWMTDNNEASDKVAVTMERTYENPMTLPEEWEDYGIGDPYVLRHNGKYYLYCSTKDWRVGVKAWSSDDLVNWTYAGLVTEEPLTEGAYAPEVVYWNGSFYMYTSPGGKGHYVLRGDSPTGPFAIKTENLGQTIDGSVFIDDDASWTFTRAESGGIVASRMSDPYTMEAGTKLNSSLGHWTEGSMIIKRGGTYFLTYTGNHVFSKGYRVNYAVGHEAPDGMYAIAANNPILISTAKDFNGLGHSATVLGPDMDAYYIVYHNLIGHSAEGPPVRMLNMDRLTFNGDKMSVLGPTHGAPTEAPALPAFRDPLGGEPEAEQWERASEADGGSFWVTKAQTDARFTAEFNAVIQPKGTGAPAGESLFETVVSFKDEQNYRSIGIDPAAGTLSLRETREGQAAAPQEAKLPDGTDLAALHAVRIESDAAGTRVYWDGLLLAERKEWQAAAGRIGYRYAEPLQPELHYTAFSNEAGGSSDAKAIKPVPGTVEAAHGLTGEGAAASLSSAETPDGSRAAKLAEGGELSFPVDVKRDGTYAIAAMVSKASAGAKLAVHAGDASERVTLDAGSFVGEADWAKVPIARLTLTKGTQWLTLTGMKGEADIRYIEAALSVEIGEAGPVAFDPEATFGDWQATDGSYALASDGQDSKLYGGDARWGDYEVSFGLTKTAESLGEASILLRMTSESDFPDQVADAFIGYELAFRNGRVILRKISYEVNEELDSALLEIGEGQTARVRVKLDGPKLTVYAEGSDEPLLAYADSSAFLHGRIGLRAGSAGWSFSEVTVSPPGKE
ncbi:family 43 glycosylhydrolase [Paenibacillus methanolicus]|uniref:Beta-xylosidase n=1 Tax=Paenibacillus methanolicus TaxID=582686 RepID=A0A5S5CJN3_9BACL|nr:family 43 glycosylhydrolase [Paenibacillus methanolicus]TYP78213.1 beta-xylosidase [Paenibacillus methanolicus]